MLGQTSCVTDLFCALQIIPSEPQQLLLTNMFRQRHKTKIFCIGLNKTGTTSLELALRNLGFKVGDQRNGELLISSWAYRDFSPIIKLAYSAEAFQDVPFSLPFTFQALDQHFPNAKFILTHRYNAEVWHSSLTRFHSKLWADGIRVPTAADLTNANYISKGYAYWAMLLIYTVPHNDLYNKQCLIDHYCRHNENIIDYFRHRIDKLITINVSKPGDYKRMCDFLGKEPVGDCFPWLNKNTNTAAR